MNGTPVRTTAYELADKYDGTIKYVYEYALTGFAIEVDDAKAPALADEPAVCYVEQDCYGSLAD